MGEATTLPSLSRTVKRMKSRRPFQPSSSPAGSGLAVTRPPGE
jgi:hypothetical protein